MGCMAYLFPSRAHTRSLIHALRLHYITTAVTRRFWSPPGALPIPGRTHTFLRVSKLSPLQLACVPLPRHYTAATARGG